MGLGQWIIIIILVAIIVFGFAAVVDWSKGVIRNVYPQQQDINEPLIIANVTKIIDGDTIDIEGGERIRLAIINTPERGQPGYDEAKQYTTDHCLGKNALIDLDDAQERTFGRLVAIVYCDVPDQVYFINLGLLQNGLAVVMTHFCKFSEFKDGILCHNVSSK